MEINLVKKNGGQCNFLCLIGQLEEKKIPVPDTVTGNL